MLGRSIAARPSRYKDLFRKRGAVKGWSGAALDGEHGCGTFAARGEAAFIQRCHVHKKRNVVDHLPDEHKADVKRKLQNAYAIADYAKPSARWTVGIAS